jgi:TPR repeat protein
MRQYLNAAEAGHPVAQYQIGVLYERGQGTARDLNAARAWYVRAAAQGHEDAKRQLERIGLGLLRY